MHCERVWFSILMSDAIFCSTGVFVPSRSRCGAVDEASGVVSKIPPVKVLNSKAWSGAVEQRACRAGQGEGTHISGRKLAGDSWG